MPWLELGQGRIRKEWRLVEETIEKEKIPSSSDSDTVSISREEASIGVRILNRTAMSVPIIIRTTFHPDWIRDDGLRVYPVSPFFMLTFATDGFRVRFRRTGIEQAALAISACAFFVLFLAMIAPNPISRWRRIEFLSSRPTSLPKSV